jgi:hypothetical protein
MTATGDYPPHFPQWYRGDCPIRIEVLAINGVSYGTRFRQVIDWKPPIPSVFILRIGGKANA